MEEKELTEKESLELITSMIARTKVRYLGSGNILLMWGYLVVAVSAIVWIMCTLTHHNAWNWLWLAIPFVGIPVSALMSRKENRDCGAITYSDKITSQLWSIFGGSVIVLTLICLGFAFLGGINCWIAMLVYSLLIAPFAEIAQGLIVKEKCLIFGGAFGLVAGVITVCCVVADIPLLAKWYMPLYISVWIAMMIIPGYILNHKAKKA